MKQFIIIMASLMLGIIIYNMIAGPDEGSIMSSVKHVWEEEIEMRTGGP